MKFSWIPLIVSLIPSAGFSAALDLQGSAYNSSGGLYTYTVIKPPTGVSACLIYNAVTNRMDAVEFDGSMQYDSYTDRVGVSTATFELLKGYAEQVAADAGDAAVIEAEGVESRMTTMIETQISSLSSGTALAIAALPTVAHTGAYSDLTGKPALFSGSYADLSGKPSLFSGAYADLTGKPSTFTPSSHAHAWADITSGKPTTLAGYGITDGYSSTNPSAYINQASARTAISLTTTGTGAASYNSSTGVFNVPTPDVITAASGSNAGTMSAADFTKLAAITGTNTGDQISVTGNAGTVTTINGRVTVGQGITLTGSGTAASPYNVALTKRQVPYSGITNGSGDYTILFGTAFGAAPNIQANIVGGTDLQRSVITSITASGFTVRVVQQNTNTLLGIVNLVSTTSVVSGAAVDVLVTEK